MATTDHLPFTRDIKAQQLLATSHTALLIGMVLYQQIPAQTAFAGPALLAKRLGTDLDVSMIAAMDPVALENIFRERPALHRFPGNMAKRTQGVCEFLTTDWGGDPVNLWKGADTADEVITRFTAIPGFGDYKARIYFGVLSKWFGVRPSGWQEYTPDWPTIRDVDTFDDLAELRIRKKAWKEASTG